MAVARYGRYLWLLGTLGVLLCFLAGCGGNSGDGRDAASGVSRLTLQMFTADQVLAKSSRGAALSGQLRQVMPGEPGFLTRLVVSIRAADILPITQEFSLTPDEQQEVQRDLVVPIGTDRLLTVSAFNNSGNEIFRSDELRLDLTQGPQTVSITLSRILVPTPVTPTSLAGKVFRFSQGAVFGINSALG